MLLQFEAGQVLVTVLMTKALNTRQEPSRVESSPGESRMSVPRRGEDEDEERWRYKSAWLEPVSCRARWDNVQKTRCVARPLVPGWGTNVCKDGPRRYKCRPVCPSLYSL